MKPIRFLMIGGFLGAGKTTTIGKLAAHYVAAGKNVALVTNDQAYDLVDTRFEHKASMSAKYRALAFAVSSTT